MTPLQNYIKDNQSRFLQELFTFLRIPSVSALSSHQEDMEKAANFVREQLDKAGADKAYLIPTKGNPLVFAEKKIDVALPTVLVYGHYDVMPVDPLDLWDNPPFEPVITDDKIYARGAADDKGQIYAHIKALEAMLATGRLRCNVKFLIEGEEETSSEGIEEFLKDPDNQELIAADVLLVSDTSLIGMDTPSMDISLRGVCSLEITAEGPNRDLHSGVYGGAVMNPAEAIAKIVGQLKDKDGKVLVPGFYEDVETLSAEERAEVNRTPYDEKTYTEELGITEVFGEKSYTTLERLGIRPALEVNGIYGGYTGEGLKTVLPAKAHAKLSVRSVPHQQGEKVLQQIDTYVRSIAPKGVRISTQILHAGSKPLRVARDSKGIEAASRAFEMVWGKRPILKAQGASIPILSNIQEAIAADVVMLGFGLDSDNIHSPNEHFGVENFLKGIETIAAFFHSLAVLDQGDQIS